MEYLSAIPMWDEKNKSLIDGIFFNAPSVCKKQKNKICRKFYESIIGKKGFYICPLGLTAYSSDAGKVFSGVKVAGYYDIKKTKKYNDYLPTIPRDVFFNSVLKTKETNKKKEKVVNCDDKFDTDLIDFSIHEIRRYNTAIKMASEEFLQSKNISQEIMIRKVKNIFASSSLISIRLNAFDFEENPEIITSQRTYNSGVFKKFQKASRCLDSYAKDLGVNILPFDGASHLTMEVYQIFDLIPFVILENAIKYSPKGQQVTVKFDETQNKNLTVTVSSIGPCNTPDEIKNVFNKKYRGYQAEILDGTGGGYGLYFARTICDLHGISISAKSGESIFELDGVQYGEFIVSLDIVKI